MLDYAWGLITQYFDQAWSLVTQYVNTPGTGFGFLHNPLGSILIIWVIFNVAYCTLVMMFCSGDRYSL